jgi:phage shock protein PspC (stress-responsive transcriptional regulator)
MPITVLPPTFTTPMNCSQYCAGANVFYFDWGLFIVNFGNLIVAVFPAIIVIAIVAFILSTIHYPPQGPM